MTTESTTDNDRPVFFSTIAGADTWRQGAARRAQALGRATELMCDLAELAPGSRVLDLAAGTGEQSLVAARRVLPSGSVLATDVSAQMLEVAAESARQAGLSNIETLVGDAQSVDLSPDSFDAAISRLGLMFLRDLQQALRGIHNALRPGGKFAAIVWGPAGHNGLTVTAGAVGLRYLSRPPGILSEERLFALGNEGALAGALVLAGFKDVQVQAEPANRLFASAAEATQELLATFPYLSQARTHLQPADLDQLINDLEEALRKFDGPDGFVGPGEVVVGVGTK